MRRRAADTAIALAAIALAVAAPAVSCGPAAPAGYCETILSAGEPPATLDALDVLRAEVQAALYPELAGVEVALEPLADLQFFAANVDLSTLDAPPLQRRYVLLVDPALFADPPSYAAAAAVLAHELAHVLDYSRMDADELAAFALWYATADDVADYERATDEVVLERGCGEALIAFRLWLYDHVDPSLLDDKLDDYYTPEEIEDWMASHD